MATDASAKHKFSTLLKTVKKGYDSAKKVSEKGGDFLGAVTQAEKTQARHVKPDAVQAQKTENVGTDNIFQQQLPKLGKRLLGRRFSRVANMVTRFVPDTILQKTTNSAFIKIAGLAEQWSKLDLPGGLDFSNLHELSHAERAELAKSVASQNRAMAAVGSGVTGLTGLLGTIADLLWLLLLSLRLIYQTSEIYGEKLTGISGAKRAFALLAEADLSMLTEKQAVLVSMGAASELVDEADLHVLQGLIDKDNNITFFQETVKNIAEQFNIDLNFGWLLKILPIAAGVTSAVYSVYIINEVSAVVHAEFSNKGIGDTQKKITNQS